VFNMKHKPIFTGNTKFQIKLFFIPQKVDSDVAIL